MIIQQSYFASKTRAAALQNIDSILRRLLESRVIKGAPADVTEDELKELAIQVSENFLNEDVCLDLELNEPLYILGDIFGQYGDLLHIFQHLGFPPHARYLFLGNYIDRGRNSIEVLTLLFCFKLKFPNHIFMLRGNHECEYVSCQYGFYGECIKRYSKNLWRAMMRAFDCLPAVAIIENCIFCVHSGLSQCLIKSPVANLDHLRLYLSDCIRRPVSLTDNRFLTELTWSEPMLDTQNWIPNPAGLGHNFGSNVVNDFCERFGLQLIIRGHDMLDKGYEFTASNQLLTVFSAPNLSGDFRNLGAIVQLRKKQDTVQGRVKVVKPITQRAPLHCRYYPLLIEDSLSSAYLGTGTSETVRRSATSLVRATGPGMQRRRATFFMI